MAAFLLWTCALMMAAHLILSTATDTQTDGRRKPTRQHRKPIPTAAVDVALPWHTPPPSASPPTTTAAPSLRSPSSAPVAQQVLWVTGNVWRKNNGGEGGGGTTRRISQSRKLRRNETTVFTPSSSSPPPPPPPPSAPRNTDRRVAPAGVQDSKRNASRHAEAQSNAHGHHQNSVTTAARVDLSPRLKTSHDEVPSHPPSPSPPSPGVDLDSDDGSVHCVEACDTSRCPQVEAEACKGLVVKDNCNCCPVCVVATRTNHSKNDFGPKHPSNACDGMVCEKNKVCILNIQGIPMCRCRNIYICRSAERRPVCTVNGTFKNKCFLQVEECSTGKRIRVVHRGACRARSPARQLKPYL